MFRHPTWSMAVVVVLLWCPPAVAAERLCDPAAEDCRAILLDLIRNETQGIDAAFWFMEDDRYAAELIRRAQAGVPVRVIVDPRAPSALNTQILAELAAAGIPMRRRSATGILHWKMMLFAGQQTVQFSAANYSPTAFVPIAPYSNYTDEAILFSDDVSIVQSFMRRFDDLWINTTRYGDYANIAVAPARHYPLYAVDPQLNFPAGQSYRARAVSRYAAETQGIDVIMYRITDAAHSDAMIAALQRGVPVRLITEPQQYRDPTRLWHSWNVDRMYMAGVQIRHRAHAGLLHQKSVLLRGQAMAIFGSSNWTSPSSDSQEEHNDFTTKPLLVDWFAQQFDRKWNNLVGVPETVPFQPLPPDPPIYLAPTQGASNVPLTTALVFDAGPFAHLYDIYFGTAPDPPLIAQNVGLGPTAPGGSPRRFALPLLQANTVYFWRVVAKTMALQEQAQVVSSFATGTQVVAPGPASSPAPGGAPCLIPSPAPGWVCVSGGWIPPGMVSAPPPAQPAPAPSGATCLTVMPAPGWICVNGGWVPPGYPLANTSATTTPPPSPVPPAPLRPTQGACLTPSPATGWVCVNGGWVPPNHPIALALKGGG